jgi:hypothetical protein
MLLATELHTIVNNAALRPNITTGNAQPVTHGNPYPLKQPLSEPISNCNR